MANKLPYRRDVYTTPEGINPEEYIVATYIVCGEFKDYVKLAAEIAVEQSFGTWVPVAAETPELVEKHAAKVIGAFEVPDYTANTPAGPRQAVLRIAFPIINFGPRIPNLLTAVIGNISMIKGLKLVDLEFPPSYLKGFPGPQFGVDGIRKMLDVPERPLLNNMIKPCAGLSPDVAGKLFYETAVGGIDIIKDDELIADTTYSSIADRTRECMKAEKAAFEETGEHTIYFCNVTDTPNKILDNAKAALDEGANGLMINPFTAGIGCIQMIAEANFGVPIMTHPDFVGSNSWSPYQGLSAHLTLGKLSRMAGSDVVVYPTSYGKIDINKESYVKVAFVCQNKMSDLKPIWPMPSGGAHAGMTKVLVDDCGKDIVIGCGAAVHAHPMGPRAGARALRQAVDAYMQDVDLREYAANHKELQVALDLWGVAGEKEIFGLKA
ncbi:MAG: ribulose 1,5-bisphosphate carboxylase [Chloroflexi bacterium]|nr:ribulose 1,5-bisphosphate carboxylase [Chloroflexota bacterium]